MNDITNKITTLRTAIATGIVSVSKPETILRIQQNEVPKGHVFEMAKAAGLLAVKKTSDVIPDCHPMPIESAQFRFEISGNEIHIFLEVKTIYKTGVEVEAMHGVSVAALTMYDMLKPIDKQVEIRTVKLVEKKGGKSDFRFAGGENIRAAVVVCSDSVSSGLKRDTAGESIVRMLQEQGVTAEDYCVIPDEQENILGKAIHYHHAGFDLVIYTGGTGVSPRDVTPDALLTYFDREIPGIPEAARNFGQQRMPYAMLSRSVAGMKGKTLYITVPGSARAAEESMHVLFPYVLHAIKINAGSGHEPVSSLLNVP